MFNWFMKSELASAVEEKTDLKKAEDEYYRLRDEENALMFRRNALLKEESNRKLRSEIRLLEARLAKGE
jgi:hypothetical protein